jgi:flavin reductase (DIM6/NTAB) family NADH-FMN oxidoreductase RutF
MLYFLDHARPDPVYARPPTMPVGANAGGKPDSMTAVWATAACVVPPMICVAIEKAMVDF